MGYPRMNKVCHKGGAETKRQRSTTNRRGPVRPLKRNGPLIPCQGEKRADP